MTIKCYLYSDRTRQINHKYYSLSTDRDIRLFLDLKQDTAYFSKLENKAFVYEVEIKPEAVLECEYLGLTATEFKIVREVKFIELVNTYEFSTVTKNEIYSILNGTAESRNVTSLYERVIQKSKWNLSEAEQFKLLAILNQNHYELPTINITWCYQIPYVKILKFFNKPYSTDNNDSSVLHKIKREELYGSKDFETGIELPMKELICHINLKQYIETRKLSQEQFEEYCEYMFHEERTIYYGSHAIAAGYKILPKYKKHFYPYLIYSDPEMALELLNKRNITRTEVNYFYEKNYKIGDYNFSSDKVKETKSIFLKDDDYKYIEVATQ